MTERVESTERARVEAEGEVVPVAECVEDVMAGPIGGMNDVERGGELARAGELSVEEVVLAGPARMVASYGERVKKILAQVGADVPAERRVAAAPVLSAAIMEKLKYLEEEDPLRGLYIRLLTSAVDRQSQGDAHPAFVSLIEQLSRDEAVLLMCLKQRDLLLTKKNKGYDPGRPKSGTTFFLPNIAPDIDAEEVPKGLVEYPRHIKMYLSHLLSMNLIKIKPPPVVDHRIEWLTWLVCPTDFGGLFLSACVPGAGGGRTR